MTNAHALRPIASEADYTAALAIVEELMGAELDTPAGRALDAWVTLIEAYEARHWPIDPPDPIDALRARMERQQLQAKDLLPYLGTSGRVSEILNRRRALTLPMIRRLSEGLGIPAQILVRETVRPFEARPARKQKMRARKGKPRK